MLQATTPLLAATVEMVFMVIAFVAVVMGLIAMLISCYHKATRGMALIRSGHGGAQISFQGLFVFPIIHSLEKMDVGVKNLHVELKGDNGLLCRDDVRADIRTSVLFYVEPDKESVLAASQFLGCEKAGDPEALQAVFKVPLSGALKHAARQLTFDEIRDTPERYKERVRKAIAGADLHGFVFDAIALDSVEAGGDSAPEITPDSRALETNEGPEKVVAEVAETTPR